MQIPTIFPNLSVFENLWLASWAATSNALESSEVAVHLIDWIRIEPEQSQKPAGELAHGLQQWLEIAMVLARDPSVVLLDEPTSGLTLQDVMRLTDAIADIGRSIGVFVVEHDMKFVEELASPVTVLVDGHVFAADREMEALRADPELVAVYLGRHNEQRSRDDASSN
jgi:ABC-type uncharacterized transport system ATPase subunit